MSFLYIVLAALGLGFLIFIHELGHYWVARRVGIVVEAFSIGFGRAIVSWKRDGVEWRIGWLPFGGYVRMKGTDKKEDKEPHEIAGGFFHAKPINRVKVALAGPVVNFIFAFLAFTLLWVVGGRDKPFSEFTHRVGWVDPQSELFEAGLRPGDIVESYDEHAVTSARDHLHAPLLGGDEIEVRGYHVNYPKATREPFDLTARTYAHPYSLEEGVSTLGIFYPAQYLIYNRLPSGGRNPLPPGSPMESSGIRYGDRLFWADGSLLFSSEQLGSILSKEQALVTVERAGRRQLARVPRVPIRELSLTSSYRGELEDWHYAIGLPSRVDATYSVPYELSPEGVIESRLSAIDEDVQAELFPRSSGDKVSAPLEIGDRIVAIDGVPTSGGQAIMRAVQQHQVMLIAERAPGGWPILPAAEADRTFDQGIDWNALAQLTAALGSPQASREIGNFVLLGPIEPVSVLDLERAAGREQQFLTAIAEQRAQIEKLRDAGRRERLLQQLKEGEQRLRLGIELQDRMIRYNPAPWVLFGNVMGETWHTWKALVSGYLNPKWISGPVGIVQVMQYGWALGFREALFWLAVISLNLAILNLLPIPVLDGGQVCFALWEMVTRRRIKAATMEKLVIPFVILLVGFFIFVTYQDLSRLFRGIF